MSVWTWAHEYVDRAVMSGDPERARIFDFFRQGFEERERDPRRALHFFEEGKRHAEVLGEAWWRLFYENWYVHGLIYYAKDFREVLDRAVKNALEARKPIYVDFPQRIGVHIDLISAHVYVDPLGYLELIEPAIRYILQELRPDWEYYYRYLLMEQQRAVATAQDDFEGAKRQALDALQYLSTDPSDHSRSHYSMCIYGDLCEVSFKLGNWADLRQWAAASEEAARKRGFQLHVAEATLWKAICERHEGNEPSALRLTRNALNRVASLKMPSDYLHELLAEFHTAGGDFEPALRCRDRQLQILADKGRYWAESEYSLKRCQLLVKMGHLTDEDVAGTRAVIARLKKPERSLAKLDAIIGS